MGNVEFVHHRKNSLLCGLLVEHERGAPLHMLFAKEKQYVKTCECVCTWLGWCAWIKHSITVTAVHLGSQFCPLFAFPVWSKFHREQSTWLTWRKLTCLGLPRHLPFFRGRRGEIAPDPVRKLQIKTSMMPTNCHAASVHTWGYKTNSMISNLFMSWNIKQPWCLWKKFKVTTGWSLHDDFFFNFFNIYLHTAEIVGMQACR